MFSETTHPSTVPLECIFKALGHPVRLRLVRALFEGERCVCELIPVAGLAPSTVSRHLSVLKDAGILAEEKRGQQVFYRLLLRSVRNFVTYMENPTFRRQVDTFVEEFHDSESAPTSSNSPSNA